MVVKQNCRGKSISNVMIEKAIDFIVYVLGKIKIKLFGQAYLKDFLVNSGFKKIFEESL